MSGDLVNRLRNLAEMIPRKHTLPSGYDTVICSLEAFMQIKELAGDAADAIEELSKPRWIPVTEGLPDEKQAEDVLCWIMDRDPKAKGYCVSGYYNTLTKSWWLDADWVASWKITHWMPAPQGPEPPKEE